MRGGRIGPNQRYLGVTKTRTGSGFRAVAHMGRGISVSLGVFQDERTAALATVAAAKVPIYRALGAVQVLLLGMWVEVFTRFETAVYSSEHLPRQPTLL